jgi:hypothetical protein
VGRTGVEFKRVSSIQNWGITMPEFPAESPPTNSPTPLDTTATDTPVRRY